MCFCFAFENLETRKHGGKLTKKNRRKTLRSSVAMGTYPKLVDDHPVSSGICNKSC